MQTDTMTNYHIRKYKDDDYKMARAVLERGIWEQVLPSMKYSLNLPRSKLFLLAVPLTLFFAFKSFLYCAAAAALYVAFVWYGSRHIFMAYVYRYLEGDMKDIQQYYMRKKGACFWVAESKGEVIGVVAAEPYKSLDGGRKLELKRMSVSKAHRIRGVGKALCQTVISFAKKEDYESVILDTTIIHSKALLLYERLGFKRTRSYVAPHFFGRMLHMIILDFIYDIPRHD